MATIYQLLILAFVFTSATEPSVKKHTTIQKKGVIVQSIAKVDASTYVVAGICSDDAMNYNLYNAIAKRSGEIVKETKTPAKYLKTTLTGNLILNGHNIVQYGSGSNGDIVKYTLSADGLNIIDTVFHFGTHPKKINSIIQANNQIYQSGGEYCLGTYCATLEKPGSWTKRFNEKEPVLAMSIIKDREIALAGNGYLLITDDMGNEKNEVDLAGFIPSSIHSGSEIFITGKRGNRAMIGTIDPESKKQNYKVLEEFDYVKGFDGPDGNIYFFARKDHKAIAGMMKRNGEILWKVNLNENMHSYAASVSSDHTLCICITTTGYRNVIFELNSKGKLI